MRLPKTPSLIFFSSLGLETEALKLTSLGSFYEGLSGNNNADVTSEDRESNAPSCASDGHLAPSSVSCSSVYGVDRSFPIHRSSVAVADPNENGGESRQAFYEEFLQGCRQKYSPEGFLCDDTEAERVEMNLRQPASMYNYTALGFHKTRAPAKIMDLLGRFWRDNDFHDAPAEPWDPGNTYTNHWAAPTRMMQIGAAHLQGGGEDLRSSIWDAVQPPLELWTGTHLNPSSLYGVRVYSRGAVLAPHVDRMPLVISAIINVAQSVEEPWPLELYGHDGRAYNVTMEPGDMLLYESHSVIHGRPFPLNGDYYANVFIHFEPMGHTLGHDHRLDEESLEYLYQEAWNRQKIKCGPSDKECLARLDLNVYARAPHYILEGSLEEKRWIQKHPLARLPKKEAAVSTYTAHAAASIGDLDSLIAMALENPESIKKVDANGWTPMHEAARGGYVEVVAYLMENGLDVNQRTHDGNGGSPLWWAKHVNGDDHPVVKYLEEIGAEEIKPDD